MSKVQDLAGVIDETGGLAKYEQLIGRQHQGPRRRSSGLAIMPDPETSSVEELRAAAQLMARAKVKERSRQEEEDRKRLKKLAESRSGSCL